MARRRKRAGFVETGVKFTGVGALFLLLPSWMSASGTSLGPAFRILRTPGWIFLGVGITMLILYFLNQRIRKKTVMATARPRRSKIRAAVAASGSSARTRPDPHADRATEVRDYLAENELARQQDRLRAAPALAVRRPEQWSARVFDLIEWRRFEQVCEALFGQAGFETRSQSHGADGGVDIWLHSAGFDEPVAVVQCKHWKNRPVPAEQVRAFLGVMTANRLKRGTFATSSTFTADALAFGRANGINLQDGAGLLGLIRGRTPEQQTELLAVALEGEFWKPSCPSCGTKLVVRHARKSGRRFWGCSHYPRCRYTLPITDTEAKFLEASSASPDVTMRY